MRLPRHQSVPAFLTAAVLLVTARIIPSAAQAPAPAVQAGRALGVDTASFDRTVRPQDDFFRFVNGTWLAKTTIPPDRSTWGSFVELTEKSETAVRGIIEHAAAAQAPAGSETQKVGDFYASFMDTVRIERLGLTPLQQPLAAIAGLTTRDQLPTVLAHLARIGVPGLFGASVGQDQKNSNAYIVSISQGGLGLPDRDYYLRQDPKFATIRQQYADYVARLFTLAHQPDPAGAAGRIVALETEIARRHWDRARSRDREKTYNKMSLAELASLTPSFHWNTYLTAGAVTGAREVVVRQPDFLQALDTVITTTPLTTWKEYLTYKVLNEFADLLPNAFVDARFDFSGRTLQGQQENRARWKRGVAATQGALGEAIGKLYVEQYFPAEAKARMATLVQNLLEAFKAGIEELEWMSPATKAQAQAKLAKFTVKIGYPDRWRDYSALDVKPDDLIGNAMRAARFQYDDNVGRLGKPVDRARWGMTPQTVNAYYNSTNNEIVFPAAILQPPFFNVDADDAVNYGAIGAVIGHEISHGFDDQGSKSDGDGNLRNWFTPEDLAGFQARTSALADQYSAYEPLPGIHINGRLTLGENIGDLSGLAVALRAYHMSLHSRPTPVIGGFNGDQRFFLGWGQVWRTAMRDEALRNQLLTNPHSPGMYRALVPLTNLEAFYRAWDVKAGDAMYRPPEERVKIW